MSASSLEGLLKPWKKPVSGYLIWELDFVPAV